jgi:nucleoside-diphosphate-sugar epimerase
VSADRSSATLPAVKALVTGGADTVALRLGNVYGPRQNPRAEAGVIAIFCGRLVQQQPVTVYGGEIQRTAISPVRTEADLGWRAAVRIDDGLNETAAWVRSRAAGASE